MDKELQEIPCQSADYQSEENNNNRVRMMYYSKSHRQTRKKEIRVLLSGVEPKTFRLLVRLLYHRATGDSWELRPLN